MRAPALALALSVALSAASTARAQPSGLRSSLVDLATVRVFGVRGVRSVRAGDRGAFDRLIAVPEATRGSGLAISEDGLVITARHLVEGAERVVVWEPHEGRAALATVVHSNAELGFALLLVDARLPHHVVL